MQVGDRVGAIFYRDRSGLVHFFGFGVYEGDFVPEEAVGETADVLRLERRTNPKITLDSGQIVWGCECWWGPEEDVRTELGSAKLIHTVDIDEMREQYWEESDAD